MCRLSFSNLIYKLLYKKCGFLNIFLFYFIYLTKMKKKGFNDKGYLIQNIGETDAIS